VANTTVNAGDVIRDIGYQFADGQKIVGLRAPYWSTAKELRLYGF